MIKGDVGMEDNKRGRINIYLAQHLKEYVDNKAKDFGLSTSAFMTMIIQQYKVQDEAMTAMGDMGQVLEKLNELENKINK